VHLLLEWAAGLCWLPPEHRAHGGGDATGGGGPQQGSALIRGLVMARTLATGAGPAGPTRVVGPMNIPCGCVPYRSPLVHMGCLASRLMGHSHEHRPYVSRREFLSRSAALGSVAAAGPLLWSQPAYAAATPVRHVHVNFGADSAREMTVSWMTPGPVRKPFVELGDRRVYAQSAQYAGYPGYFHHVRLAGLSPERSYGYRVGHEDRPRTTAQAFTTGPKGGSAFRFTAFGDQGTDMPLGQPPNQPSANTALAQSFAPALHLVVGDLAYANGNQSIWDDWFGMVAPMAGSVPWMPCIGNHEIESQLDLTGTGDSWGDWGYDPYRTRFALPGNGFSDLQNCFYTFRYGSVQFLSIDNNDVNSEIKNNIGYTGGRQVAWVEQTLAAAHADDAVDFIVVLMHQCAFSSSSKHGSDEGVRAAWLDLFARYSVDLVIQGHDHTYERSHVMSYEEVVDATQPGNLELGTAYLVCGNGGAVQEPFEPLQPSWSARREALKVGTLQVEVQPVTADGMSRLTLGEYWAFDGSPIEEGIILEKPARSKARPDAAVVTAGSPSVTLEGMTAPSGAGLAGLGIAGTGLGMSLLTPERARDEHAGS
jgi:hypothetical protein